MGHRRPRGLGRLSVVAAVVVILLIGIQSIDSKVGICVIIAGKHSDATLCGRKIRR